MEFVLATTFLLLLFTPLISAGGNNVVPKTYTNFITTSCKKTTYPSLCYKTLTPYAASVKTSPLKLCNAALTVTLQSARNASNMVSKLASQRGITRTEAAAIKDCIENIQDSVDELKQSIKAMTNLKGSGDKQFQMANVKTWVSAAITDEGTCMDGFSGRRVSAAVKNKIRGSVVGVARLSSNALSLINKLKY